MSLHRLKEKLVSLRLGSMLLRVAVGVPLLGVILGTALPVLAGARGGLVTFEGDYRTLLMSRKVGSRAPGGNGDSNTPAVAVDGSSVAFVSQASNLAPRRASQAVYVRKVDANTTFLASRATGRRGAPANGDSITPAINGSGRWVAFASRASNLGGRGGVWNVYVRDLKKHKTYLASRSTGRHGAPANGNSYNPQLSGDGHLVAFASDGTNLGVGENVTGIYVRNLNTNRTTLVSRADGVHGAPANGASTTPAISFNGNAVAFESGATNLSALSTNGVAEIFERNLRRQSTVLVSRAPGAAGDVANSDSLHPSIDRTGGRVAFDSGATNLSGIALRVQNVYLRDIPAGSTQLVSRGLGKDGPPADGDSSMPSLPRDGRFVCFQSSGGNLGSELGGFPNPNVNNVFVHDTLHNGTFLISRKSGRHGAAANGDSANVACTAGASLAAFESTATNLAGRARFGVTNVYRRTIFGGH